MKAIVRNTYGSPHVLELQETDKPDLTDDGVLVRVRAASINPADWYALTGTPYFARMFIGLLKLECDRGLSAFDKVVRVSENEVRRYRQEGGLRASPGTRDEQPAG